MSQRVVNLSLAPAASDDDGVSVSQKPVAGGVQSLTITGALAAGGVATLDIARRLLITSSSDDSARTFTITGTDRRGAGQTEIIAGPATNVSTLKDFATVTAITVDDDTAGNIKVGTGGKISSQWVPIDRLGVKELGIGVRQTGTANWTIEYAMEDPFTAGVGVLPNGGNANPPYLTPYAHAVLAAKTASDSGSILFPITAARLTINTYSTGAVLAASFVPGFVGGGV